MISGKTKIYAILGDPIAQALSPIIHNAAFIASGEDSVFLGLRVTPDQLADAFAGIRAMHFSGLAVTMPLKKAILPLLDEVDPGARRLEAVNVVVNRGGRWIGYNTDGDGFVKGLSASGIALAGKRAFLFGAGGAARSIAASLARAGISHLSVCNIDPAETEVLIRLLDDTGLPVVSLPFAASPAMEQLRQADVVVNATSLGMLETPSTHAELIDWPALKPDAAFADVVHKPLEPLFLQQAKFYGHRTVTGDRMLLYQGVLAYQLWTGRPAPLEVMEARLQAWLSQESC